MVSVFGLCSNINIFVEGDIINKYMIVLIVVLLLGIVSAEKIDNYYRYYLNPSYVESVRKSAPAVFSLKIDDYNGDVKTALITFNLYAKQDNSFRLFVNDVMCKNDYYIDGRYMKEGFAQIIFDCSNVITKSGDYEIKFYTSKDIGAVFSYAEITYVDKKPKFNVFGTEYNDKDEYGKLWLQLLDENNSGISNALCFITIYTPDNQVYIKNSLMSYLDDGIYYHDFIVPEGYGVYPAVAKCYYYFTNKTMYAYYFDYNGTVSGSLQNTYSNDNIYLTITENSGTFSSIFGFTNITGLNITNIYIKAWALWDNVRGDAQDYVNFYYWNGTDWILLDNVLYYNNNKQYITNKIPFINETIFVKINDTVVDAKNTNFRIDYLSIDVYSLSDRGFKELKGSSEIHKGKVIGFNGEELLDFYLSNRHLIAEEFKSNHNFCYDNETLAHNITYEYCIEDTCKEYSYLRFEKCNYGCSSHMCNPNPIIRILIFLGVIALPIIFLKFIW